MKSKLDKSYTTDGKVKIFSSEDDVNKKLEEKMVHAFNEVYSIKKEKSVPMRIASFMVAIDRVHSAYNLREG